jgi:uncharacterized protein YdaU (DUF1376 family)
MNFYPFHIGDYASATRHLTWEEDLAYRRLIDAYYTREAPIPLDKRQAYRLVCASTNDQREAIDSVLGEFFIETEQGYTHNRCDEEIAIKIAKSEKAARSAKARWNAEQENDASHSERNANASEELCERIGIDCEGNAPIPIPIPKDKTILSESDDSNSLPAETKTDNVVKIDSAKQQIPYQQIVDAYHEALPELPRAVAMSDSRKRLIKSRWLEMLKSKRPDGTRRYTDVESGIAWWRLFFKTAGTNKFWMGENDRGWTANLDWLMKNNWKVVEHTPKESA